MYPDFECWFYIHKETVPQATIDKLIEFSNVKIIFKEGDINNENCKPRMWRFEPIDHDDVEIMMSRDTDTRFLLREKLAVDDWLNSNKLFHIMRDHPHHRFCILGGMFGTRKIPQIPCWTNLMNLFIQNDIRMYDQNFLKDFIYPHIVLNSKIHANYHKIENNCEPFPINYDNEYHFVGEYVYSDETRSEYHTNELKNTLYN